MKKLIYPIVFTSIFLTSCGGRGDKPAVKKTVDINGDSTIYLYDFQRPYIYKAKTGTKTDPLSFNWSISNETLASINEFGYLTPKGVGDIQLTVTLKSDTSYKGMKNIRIVDSHDFYDSISESEYAQIYGMRYEQTLTTSYEKVSVDEFDRAYNLNTLDEYKFYDLEFNQNKEEYDAQFRNTLHYDVDGVKHEYKVYSGTEYNKVKEYLEQLTKEGYELRYYIEKDKQDDGLLVIEGYINDELMYLHAIDNKCLIQVLGDYIPDSQLPEKSVFAICHFTYE